MHFCLDSKTAESPTKHPQSQNDSSTERTPETPVQPIAPEAPPLHNTRRLKRSIPSKHLIKQESITEFQEEWLYNHPDFLACKSHVNVEEAINSVKKHIHGSSPSFSEAMRPFTKDNKSEKFPFRAVIIDIPKNAKGKGGAVGDTNPENSRPLSNVELYDKLRELRTAKNAKKRLVWSPNPDQCTAFLCLAASPESEMDNFRFFCDRYDRKEKHFFDETTAMLNLWTTEFHLSCYEIFDTKDEEDYDLAFLGGKKQMRKAAFGFRFLGDFCDRYWTCHVFEHLFFDRAAREEMFQNNPTNSDFLCDRVKKLFRPREQIHEVKIQNKAWRQRKVFELLLFDQMLHNILSCYGEIIEEIGDHLKDLLPYENPAGGKHTNVISIANALFTAPMTNDDYSSISNQWRPTEYTLQSLEEDLNQSLETITLWEAREKERQSERPRWTSSDETKYRTAITKMTASNNRGVRELRHHLATIQTLRTILSRKLESTRDELSYRNAENVRFFTYVTAVFLPAGFAAAVFSMNGVPKVTILKRMIPTLVGLLILTFAVLVSQSMFRRIYHACKRPIRTYRNREESDQKSFTEPTIVPEDEISGGKSQDADADPDNERTPSTAASRRPSHAWGNWLEKYRGKRKRNATREAPRDIEKDLPVRETELEE